MTEKMQAYARQNAQRALRGVALIFLLPKPMLIKLSAKTMNLLTENKILSQMLSLLWNPSHTYIFF